MLNGRCGCGAVTYRMTSAPMYVHCCHCTDCQRQTGSAFVLNAIIEHDRVEIDGPTVQVTLPTPSGHGQVLTRCADCGVAVCSAYMVRQGKMLFVRVGTLDDPSQCPPTVQIFTATKLPWVVLTPDIPIFEAFYDPAEVLPPEALARRDALFAE